MKLQKIVISGMGGVGGYYGTMLNEYARLVEGLGREVHFVARGEHLKQIQERGLHLKTPTRDIYSFPSSVSDQPLDIGIADLIIVATKSYDLENNIKELRPMIGERTILLPLLNGANISAQIRTLLPNTTVWDGCTYISARKPKAGEIILESDRESLFFGSASLERKDEEIELLELFIRSGVNAHNPEDIDLVIRKKFIMISATATGTSYFDANVGKALSEHPQEMRLLLEEVCALSQAEGYKLEDDAVEAAIKRQHIMPSESTSSMHIDFINRSRTELENLCGYVVHRSAELGISVPTYKQMYQALKLREESFLQR